MSGVVMCSLTFAAVAAVERLGGWRVLWGSAGLLVDPHVSTAELLAWHGVYVPAPIRPRP